MEAVKEVEVVKEMEVVKDVEVEVAVDMAEQVYKQPEISPATLWLEPSKGRTRQMRRLTKTL